jgi:predicted small secreted protein
VRRRKRSIRRGPAGRAARDASPPDHCDFAFRARNFRHGKPLCFPVWAVAPQSKGHTDMTRKIAPVLAILALIASASALTACNTTAGAGEDVSSAGHAVTNGAEAVKSKL